MTIEKLLITQLVNYINDHISDIGLPCYVTIGTPFYATGTGLWAQVLGRAQAAQKYLRGPYSASYPFALYYRQSATEVNGYEASMLLPFENLDEYLTDETFDFDGYHITKIYQSQGASPFQKGEDGTLIYQATFTIEFTNTPFAPTPTPTPDTDANTNQNDEVK